MKPASQWIREHGLLTLLEIFFGIILWFFIMLLFNGCHWPGVDNPQHRVHYPPEQWHTPINTNSP